MPAAIVNAYFISGAAAAPVPSAGTNWNTSRLHVAGVFNLGLYPNNCDNIKMLDDSSAEDNNDSLKDVSV